MIERASPRRAQPRTCTPRTTRRSASGSACRCGRARQRARHEDHRRSRLRARGGAVSASRMRTDTLSIPFWSAEEIEAALSPGARAHRGARACSRIPRRPSTASAAESTATRWTRSSRSRAARRESRFCCSSPATRHDRAARPASAGYAANLAARHWPGPLTLVLAGGERRVPERLRGPEGGVAVRWTSHPASRA